MSIFKYVYATRHHSKQIKQKHEYMIK